MKINYLQRAFKTEKQENPLFFFQSESKNTPLNQQVIKWCSKIISVLPA